MVGQFRPTQQTRHRFVPAPDLVTYSVGFALSSTISLFLIHEFVGGFLGGFALGQRLIAGAAAGLLLAIVDLKRMRSGRSCSVGPARQTPRTIGRSWLGVFAWGLDTGTGLTTIRSTSLPFFGALLTALGFGTRWIGLAYAAGFLSLLWTLCYVPKPTSVLNELEPLWIATRLRGVQPLARTFAVGIASVVALSGGAALLSG